MDMRWCDAFQIMDGWISHMETLLLCPGIRVFGTSQLSLQNKLKNMYIQDGELAWIPSVFSLSSNELVGLLTIFF